MMIITWLERMGQNLLLYSQRFPACVQLCHWDGEAVLFGGVSLLFGTNKNAADELTVESSLTAHICEDVSFET